MHEVLTIGVERIDSFKNKAFSPSQLPGRARAPTPGPSPLVASPGAAPAPHPPPGGVCKQGQCLGLRAWRAASRGRGRRGQEGPDQGPRQGAESLTPSPSACPPSSGPHCSPGPAPRGVASPPSCLVPPHLFVTSCFPAQIRSPRQASPVRSRGRRGPHFPRAHPFIAPSLTPQWPSAGGPALCARGQALGTRCLATSHLLARACSLQLTPRGQGGGGPLSALGQGFPSPSTAAQLPGPRVGSDWDQEGEIPGRGPAEGRGPGTPRASRPGPGTSQRGRGICAPERGDSGPSILLRG